MLSFPLYHSPAFIGVRDTIDRHPTHWDVSIIAIHSMGGIIHPTAWNESMRLFPHLPSSSFIVRNIPHTIIHYSSYLLIIIMPHQTLSCLTVSHRISS